MATKRFQNLDAEKRDKILRAAIEEFGEKGLDKATLQDVAARAGVAKGLLYYYFEDREDLLATLFEFVQERLSAALVETPDYGDAATFWIFVERVAMGAIRGFTPQGWMIPFMERVLDSVSMGVVPSGFEERKALTERLIGQTVMDGMRLGALRMDLPPELMQRGIGMLMRACETWLFGRIRRGEATEGDAAVIVGLMRDAFGRRPG